MLQNTTPSKNHFKIIFSFLVLSFFLWVLGEGAFLNWLPKTRAADGEGSVVIRVDGKPANKVFAGNAYELVIELTVGESGIAADNGENISIVIPAGFTEPQNSNSTEQGYVTVSSSPGGVNLDAIITGQTINIRVNNSGNALSYMDRVFIIYGDTAGGTNPDAAAVATTTLGFYQFAAKTRDQSIGALTDLSVLPGLQVVSPIKISEVEVNGGGSMYNEFVELYNAGSAPVNLAGWKIVKKIAGAGPGMSWEDLAVIETGNDQYIPGHGFFLFAPEYYEPYNAGLDVFVSPDITYATNSIQLMPNGYVGVMNSKEVVVDYVGYGSLAHPGLAEGGSPADSPGYYTIERKAMGNSTIEMMEAGGAHEFYGNGFDSDNNKADFIIRSSADPQNSLSDTESLPGDTQGEPMIFHTPVFRAPYGSDLTVIAQMTDPQNSPENLGAELKYMMGDCSPWDNLVSQYHTAVGQHYANGYFLFTIPQSIVNSSESCDVYYYLKAGGGRKFLSKSPSADDSGQEEQVAQNPFNIRVRDSSPWTKYNISGTVTDHQTASTVPDTLVFLEGTGYFATTSEAGYYSLNDVKDGYYNVVFVKGGYYVERTENVNLTNGGRNVNKSLYPGASGGLTGDAENPFVIFTGPPDGATGLPASDENFKIFIGFSKDIDPDTLTHDNLYYINDATATATPLAAPAYYNNPGQDGRDPNWPQTQYLGVISPPSGGFSAIGSYNLILAGNIRDTAGNPLVGNRPSGGHVIAFSATVSTGDYGTGSNMPPAVLDIQPGKGITGVPVNTKIVINFSHNMDPVSVAASGNIQLQRITIDNNNESIYYPEISTALDLSGKIAVITPTANLSSGFRYRVSVRGGLRSANGIYMYPNGDDAEVYRTSFFTGSAIDDTAPVIIGAWPASGETGIALSPGAFTFQFSESLDPATVNANTVFLRRGSTNISSEIKYDAPARSIYIRPLLLLMPGANYTLIITSGSSGVKDLADNSLTANYVIYFTTTEDSDESAPRIMFADGDEYKLAITFSKPMASAGFSDADNWPSSVLNPANYVIKWGDPGTVAGDGTAIDLVMVGAQLNYDSFKNTVYIANLGLDPADTDGKDYHISMGGGLATDLSGNKIASSTAYAFQMPIRSSYDTGGLLGPGEYTDPDTADMGMKKAGVFPMNALAGQTATYFISLPTTKPIPAGGKIMITFPSGFNIGSAAKDPYSPANNDINGPNENTVTIAGVAADQTTRTITVTTGGMATLSNDYLRFDLSWIINSLIPRGYETSGYLAEVKTLDLNGNLLESIPTMPFYINEGGQASLKVSLAGISSAHVDGVNDSFDIYLGSPMTGPLEKTISVLTDGTGSTTFSGLPTGQYYLFTQANFTSDGPKYEGMSMPEPITVGEGANLKTITLTEEGTGAVMGINISIIGSFGLEDIDVFAGSPSGFKVKTLYAAGTNPSTILYLGDGDWMVGMGPARPKNYYSAQPTMPDWMPPAPLSVRVSGNGTVVAESSGTPNDGNISFTVNMADKHIIGYVRDETGAAIAEAEVFAYQPAGTALGAHARSDTTGLFTIKVSAAGNYKVGAHKPGLPYVPERSITVKDNTGVSDGNSTADIYRESGSLITTSTPFIIRINKPANTISGKVTDGTQAAAFAPVWAERTDAAGYASAMTDATGNYILYVANGTWNLNAQIPKHGLAEQKTVVINGASETQNLSPALTTSFITISGTVSDGSPLSFLPVRAVQYNSSGVYTGQEFGASTDSSGNYSLRVPADKYFRVQVWTPNYGEVGLDSGNIAGYPYNLIATTTGRTGQDMTVNLASLREINLVFNNGSASQTGYLNIEGVVFDGNNKAKPSGFRYHSRLDGLSATSSVRLPDGDYFIFLYVPDQGEFTPDASSLDNTKNCVVVESGRSVGFTLNDELTAMASISGTVYSESESGGNELSDAWVWAGNPATGFRTGAKTAADGSYSLNLPAGSGYRFGADKPGYISAEPSTIDLLASSTRNPVLSLFTNKISGYIYDDANSNTSYDPGEAVPNGVVRAETAGCTDNDNTTVCLRTQAPADGSGYYELGVMDGTWKLYGVADGYLRTAHGADVAISGADASANIKLTLDSAWAAAGKKTPLTPATGGSIDDTAPGGSGVKMTIPPNALGNSSAAGYVDARKTTAVSQTNSSDPVGRSGVNITASDNSGQAITNLNDNIDLELVMYKSEIGAALTEGSLTYAKLKSTKNAYYDNTTNDWVNIATTRRAFYKLSGDTDWTLYSETGTSSSAFVAFINRLADNTINTVIGGTMSDYKLVFTSKTNHLTIFAVIMPFIAQSAPPPADPPPPSPPSSTGGGVSYPSTCRIVEYGPWKEDCVDGYEYRDVISRSPSNCTLSIEQQNDQKRVCATETDETAESAETETTAETTEAPASINELYLAQGAFIWRAEVDEIMSAMGITERNHVGEQLSRGTLINRLKIDLAKLEPRVQYALTNFITYGSPDTLRLGWGERAGVLNSFIAAFGKVPETPEDWSDVIKIGNGRWPTERSEKAENAALAHFRKVYLRDPNRANPHDDAAVTVIAYGLRPANRNMSSEAAAARIFRAIYRYAAAGATDWDIVRAIAYSGAVR